jgi:hypothetical protein
LTATLAGLAESEKSGGAGTVRLIVVVLVRPPPVPVIVTVAAPVVAVADAASVTTVLVPVVEIGLNDAVTPPGNPLALNATLLVKPFSRVTVIVLVPLAPRLTVRFVGLAESEKSGFIGGLTVTFATFDSPIAPPLSTARALSA